MDHVAENIDELSAFSLAASRCGAGETSRNHGGLSCRCARGGTGGDRGPRFGSHAVRRQAVDVAVLDGLRSMRLRKRPINAPKED